MFSNKCPLLCDYTVFAWGGISEDQLTLYIKNIILTVLSIHTVHCYNTPPNITISTSQSTVGNPRSTFP